MRFMSSLWVKEGDFGISPISSIEEGIDFLAGWPASNRSACFYVASNALEAARAGNIPFEEACSALHAFCQEAGVLVDEIPLAKIPET